MGLWRDGVMPETWRVAWETGRRMLDSEPRLLSSGF
jgi:hypothetical protein